MEYVLIGKIINTFGIKGELKVDIYTDFVEDRFKKDSYVYVGENKIPFIMENYRKHKDFLLISFKDMLDINIVEKYKNMFVYKSLEDISPLKKGEYFFRDLLNLDVYDGEKLIGKVIRVEEGVKYNYLRVKVSNDEKLIPFLPVFIKKVILEEKKILINNIEGLV